MQLSVKSNIKDVLRDYKHLSKDIKEKAMVRALNLTGTKARTQIVDRIKEESGLKRGKVNDKVTFFKTDRFRLVARIKPTTRLNTNLIEWVTKSEQNKWLKRTKTRRGKAKLLPKGVTSKAWNRPHLYPGSFVIKGKYSGKPVVISRRNNQRKGWSRTLYGPAVWTEFSRYSRDEARKAVNKHFNKEFERQIKLLVDKQKK